MSNKKSKSHKIGNKLVLGTSKFTFGDFKSRVAQSVKNADSLVELKTILQLDIGRIDGYINALVDE